MVPGIRRPGPSTRPRAETGVAQGRSMTEVTISLENHDEELAILGSRDQFLRQVRDALGVKVLARRGEVKIEGEPDRIEQAREVFALYRQFRR